MTGEKGDTGATGAKGDQGVPGTRNRQTTETLWNQRLTLALLICFAFYQVLVVNPKTASNRDALCAFRASVEQQIAQEQDFLQHPEDFPQFNDQKVLAATRAQVDGQMVTIDALSVLSCEP